MRTDKGGALSPTSTIVQARPSYRVAVADAGQARASSTMITSEHTRSVMTRLTQGIVEVRIGLAEFPRRHRSTSD